MFFNKRDVEIQNLEHRILILEKRLEQYRREDKIARTSLDLELTDKIKELQETKVDKRVKKSK